MACFQGGSWYPIPAPALYAEFFLQGSCHSSVNELGLSAGSLIHFP